MIDFGCGSMPYEDLFDVNEYIGVDYEDGGHDVKDFENKNNFYFIDSSDYCAFKHFQLYS